jgi:TP901 family phage tail tape measure protein
VAYSVGELVGYLRLEGGPAFDRGVMGAKRSLDLTGESATKAAAALGKTEAKLAGAGQAAATLSTENTRLRAAQLSVVAAQERYNALVAAGTGNTARLASAEATLLRAQDRLAAFRPPPDPGGLVRMRTNTLRAVETLGKLGLAFGVFELARKGLEAFQAGNELTTSLNAVQAAAQASDEQMVKVRATAVGLGKDLTVPGATAVDAADAINDLVKSGIALDRAMAAARPSLLLAAAAHVKLADAAVIEGRVLDDFRLPAEQAGHVANVLAAAANSAAGGLVELSEGMKFAGPTARAVGVDVTTTSAALVLMAKSGHEGTIGGTAFANMLTRLAPVSKAAKTAMAELGVNAWDAQGKFRGLPVVVEQLHRAQERLSPKQFAQDVQIAFGNRARLAVFDFAHGGAASLDMFTKRLQAGDVQKYANTMNRGLSAAGTQLRKEFTSWAVDLNGKVQPALAEATFWLGDNLPHAISRTQHTLEPLEHELAGVFIPAWHLLAGTLGVAAAGLGDVAHLLEQHRGTVQVVGTVVLGMWAAWKGYTIAKTAVQAVSAAVETLRNRAELAGETMLAMRAGEASISSGTLALGGLGVALGVAAYAWQKHQAAVQANKQAIDSYTEAIKADSGAIAENVQQQAVSTLQHAGAYDAARKFGISLADVTDAALGNSAALGRVNSALDEWKSAMDASGASSDNVTGDTDGSAAAYYKLRDAIGSNNKQVNAAVQAAKNEAEAQGKSAAAIGQSKTALDALGVSTQYVVDAGGNLVETQTSVGDKVDDTTQKLEAQKTAADLLKQAWDALNGVNESVETTQNAFLDSLDDLTASVKANGRSLDQNSAAGRKNRETLVQIIDKAKEHAQAIADQVAATDGQTAGLQAGNAELARNEDRIRKQAAALHLSKTATDALIKAIGSIGQVKPIAHPDVDDAAAKAKAAALKKQLDALNTRATAAVVVNDGAATPRLSAIQRQLDAINGRTARAKVLISIDNQDLGRALADAAARAGGRVTFPGGHAPANAAGSGPGGVPDGWFTMNEQGWELGHKQGNKLDIYPHDQSKRMLPAGPSVPAYAGGSKAPQPVPVTVTAGGGSVVGIASYIRGQIPDVRSAVRLLSAAVDDAFQLKGLQAKIAAVKTDLANVVQARSQFASGVLSSLTGQIDLTKFGDPASMLAALRYGTATNQRFAGELTRLGKAGAPSALIQALAAGGPNSGLDALAGASKTDLAQVVKAYSAFTASAQGGGSLAGNVAFGSQIAADRQAAARYAAQSARTEKAMINATLQLARLAGRPVVVQADGKTWATTKYVDKELQGVIDELRHVLVTGRAG